MKKIKLLTTHLFFILFLLCLQLRANSQLLKDTTNNWTSLMEKGKRQKTTGIVLIGVGAGLFAACALIEPQQKIGWSIGPDTGQAVTFIGSFIATLSGAISFFSGNAKVQRARIEMGKTSYLIYPGYNSDGPSVSLKINLGK